jgi:hypothetical protein
LLLYLCHQVVSLEYFQHILLIVHNIQDMTKQVGLKGQ